MTIADSLTRKQQWLTLCSMSIVVVLISFEISSVNVALPSIGKFLDISLNTLSWIANAYTITWVVLMMLASHLGDKIGKLKTFYFGMFIFIVASFWGGIAHSPIELIMVRVLQGVGAAILWPVSMAMSYTAFDEEERGIPVGISMFTSGITLAISPLLAGALIHYLDWRWIFLCNVPLGIFAIFFVYYFAVEKNYDHREVIDFKGWLILSTMLLCFLFGLNLLQKIDDNFYGIILIICSIFLGILLYVYGRKMPHSIIDFQLLSERSYLLGSFSRLILNTMFLAILFCCSLYLQVIKHYSPVKTGVMFLAFTLVFGLFPAWVGKLLSKKNTKYFIMLGLLIFTVGLFLCSRFTILSSELFICIAFVVLGAGMGISFPSTTTLAMKIIPRDKSASATGLFFLFAVLGNCLGVAVSSVVLNYFGRRQLLLFLKMHSITLSHQAFIYFTQAFSGSDVYLQLLRNFKPAQQQLLVQLIHHAFIYAFDLNMIIYAGIMFFVFCINVFFGK